MGLRYDVYLVHRSLILMSILQGLLVPWALVRVSTWYTGHQISCQLSGPTCAPDFQVRCLLGTPVTSFHVNSPGPTCALGFLGTVSTLVHWSLVLMSTSLGLLVHQIQIQCLFDTPVTSFHVNSPGLLVLRGSVQCLLGTLFCHKGYVQGRPLGSKLQIVFLSQRRNSLKLCFGLPPTPLMTFTVFDLIQPISSLPPIRSFLWNNLIGVN